MGVSALSPQKENTASGTLEGAFAAGWPIKFWLSLVVVVSMLLLAAVMIAMGWHSARTSMQGSAALSARDAGLIITEKAHRMSEPAEATLRILATDPIESARTLDQRLRRLRTLTDVLISNALADSVFVGYQDGAFLLVRSLDRSSTRVKVGAPPKANFLVQSIQIQPSGKAVGEYLFFSATLQLLQRTTLPDYVYDPRTRAWFTSAVGTEAPVLSQPYVFFTTQRIGLTLSQVSSSGAAVFGMDVVLDDLGNSLTNAKLSPNAQLALVNEQNKVLAYFDMESVLTQGASGFEFKPLAQLGVPSLSKLNHLAGDLEKTVSFELDGRDWLGVAVPFDVWSTSELRLLIAAPTEDLLGNMRSQLQKMVVAALVLTALLLPFGWWAGAWIGKSLNKLTTQAVRMSRFDFSRAQNSHGVVQEANSLSFVMNEMGQTIQAFLQISQMMASEPKVDDMLKTVLQQMVAATRCQAGSVYLWNEHTQQMHKATSAGDMLLRDETSLAYASGQLPSTALREVGPGVTEMQIELRGRSGALEGLLMLQYANDAGHADTSFSSFVRKLSGMLAVSIESRQLIDAQKNLLDAVIRLMADAIDAKSPYTGGHCERVPKVAGMLVDHMRAQTQGPYADFHMTEDERYEFHLGAWLHDCGKVTSPEHIIDKATKLEVIYNRIHEVRMRFEVLWRDAELDYWKALMGGGNEQALADTLRARQVALVADFEFVARCNVGSEFMVQTDLQRLQSLAQMTWQRNFDNRLGLATEESLRMQAAAHANLPAKEFLLADQPFHVVPWGERKPAVEKGDPKNLHGFDMVLPLNAQNMGELYNLSVRRGTLTDEDRFKINDHMVQTLIMLRGLPWPAQLAKVADIASTHHEKLDGTGYPRRLVAQQLTTADRVMALADIFEALTAPTNAQKPWPNH